MEKYKEHKWSGEKGKKFGHAGRQEDPYQPAEGQEAALCTQCHALYRSKRWSFDPALYERLSGTDKSAGGGLPHLPQDQGPLSGRDSHPER